MKNTKTTANYEKKNAHTHIMANDEETAKQTKPKKKR